MPRNLETSRHLPARARFCRRISLSALALLAVLVLVASLAPATALAGTCPAGGEHDYHATIVREATEDADGLWLFTCSKCGATFTKPIPATGHLWGDWIVSTPATCTSEGLEYRVCKRYPDNPHYEYQVVPMLSPTGQHDWRETSRLEPTCTEPGLVTYTCSYCGKTYAEQLPALGHAWAAWEVTTQPTVTEDGIETRVCANDPSHVETRPIPATGAQPAETQTSSVAAASTEVPPVEATVQGEGAPSSAGDSQDASPSPENGFFSLVPNAADAAMLSVDAIMIVAFACGSAVLFAQYRWIVAQRRKAFRRACGGDDGNDVRGRQDKEKGRS